MDEKDIEALEEIRTMLTNLASATDKDLTNWYIPTLLGYSYTASIKMGQLIMKYKHGVV